MSSLRQPALGTACRTGRLSAAAVVGISLLLGASANVVAGTKDAALPHGDLYGDPLPKHGLARLGTMRLLPWDGVWAIALSPDGKALATGSMPGSWRNEVELWDTATGQRLGYMAAKTNNVLALAWSPDGKQLAVAHAYRVELWDAVARKRVGELELARVKNEAGGVQSLCWSGDGRWIAGCRPCAREVFVWNAATRRIAQSDQLSNKPLAVAISSDSRRLAIAGKKLLQVREIGGSRVLFDKKNLDATVNSIAISPDGRTLAGGVEVAIEPDKAESCSRRCVRLWNAANGKQKGETEPVDGSCIDVAFAADGRRLAVGVAGEAVYLLDATTLKRLAQVVSGCGQHISVSADGKKLAANHVHLAIYDTLTAARLGPWKSHWGFAWTARFSADGAAIISAGSDGVRFWDRRTGRLLRQLPGDQAYVGRCAFSHDEKQVVLAKINETGACIRSLASGELLQTINISDRPPGAALPTGLSVWAAEFSPDDSLLATGWVTGDVCLWNVRNYANEPVKRAHLSGIIARLKFSPDGNTLGCGLFMKDAHLIDVHSGRDMGAIAETGGLMPAIDFAPKGPVVAVPGYDAATPRQASDQTEQGLPTLIRLWDFQAKKQIWASEKMSCPICAAVSPRGDLIAAAGDAPNTDIWVWSVKTGKLLMKLRGSCDIATDLAFSPDGQQLLSTSQDGNVMIWDVAAAP
jgi:WD40 repeat protein